MPKDPGCASAWVNEEIPGGSARYRVSLLDDVKSRCDQHLKHKICRGRLSCIHGCCLALSREPSGRNRDRVSADGNEIRGVSAGRAGGQCDASGDGAAADFDRGAGYCSAAGILHCAGQLSSCRQFEIQCSGCAGADGGSLSGREVSGVRGRHVISPGSNVGELIKAAAVGSCRTPAETHRRTGNRGVGGNIHNRAAQRSCPAAGNQGEVHGSRLPGIYGRGLALTREPRGRNRDRVSADGDEVSGVSPSRAGGQSDIGGDGAAADLDCSAGDRSSAGVGYRPGQLPAGSQLEVQGSYCAGADGSGLSGREKSAMGSCDAVGSGSDTCELIEAAGICGCRSPAEAHSSAGNRSVVRNVHNRAAQRACAPLNSG